MVTGQVGRNPKVLLWDLETKEPIGKCSIGRGGRAVKCLSFSRCG